MPFEACIRYLDNVDGCERGYFYIRDPQNDLTKLQTFCASVAPLLGATADKIGIVHTSYIEIVGSGTGEFGQHVQVNLKDNTDGKRRGFALPAPSKDLFELKAGVYRLKATYGAQLNDYFRALTGLDTSFVSGAPVGPQPSPG